MSTRVSREEFVDDLDRPWVIEAVFNDNGTRDLFVVAPGFERSRLTPKHKTASTRPSVDSEEPLPLENL